jgi:hypothetical protein
LAYDPNADVKKTACINFVDGGLDQQFGGQIFTDLNTDGLKITGNDFTNQGPGSLTFLGLNIELGTDLIPANVTINGVPFPPEVNQQDVVIGGTLSNIPDVLSNYSSDAHIIAVPTSTWVGKRTVHFQFSGVNDVLSSYGIGYTIVENGAIQSFSVPVSSASGWNVTGIRTFSVGEYPPNSVIYFGLYKTSGGGIVSNIAYSYHVS